MQLHIQIQCCFRLCACLTLLCAFLLAAPDVRGEDYESTSLERTVEYLERDIARYRDQAETYERQAQQYKELAENAEREAQKARQAQDKQSRSDQPGSGVSVLLSLKPTPRRNCGRLNKRKLS